MSTAYLEEANLGVLKYIRTGERVLDVGCGRGRLGLEIRNRGNTVHGIEIDVDAAAVAATRLELVHQGDATDLAGLPPEIRAGGYDTIVFADVLEHLVDPAGFLKQVTPLLKPGGRLIVSLPNVVSWPIRLRILRGDFTYEDTGVLDRTHLRFFTRKTARALVEGVGFRVTDEGSTPYLTRALLPMVKKVISRGGDSPAAPSDATARSLVDSAPYKLYAKWVEPLEVQVTRLRPEWLAFQFVFVGVRD